LSTQGSLQRVKDWLPVAAQRRLKRLTRWPPVGTVRMGGLRRVTPISRTFGFDRGLPIDRHYIERFLSEESAPPGGAGTIRGHVLEFGDDIYTRRYGGRAVEQIDVLDVDASNDRATLVADITVPAGLPRDRFDAIICTQTLPFIYDVGAAVAGLHAMLKPGGSLLLTVPGVAKVWRRGDAQYGDYWRFTSRSVETLLRGAFGAGDVRVVAFGNVLTAAAFLYGLATSELTAAELDEHDPDFEVIIAARATKGGA
jgi:SAM-dependent methyltransferase